MIRVVDTNIIVSALLQPLGPPARVFELAVDGWIQLCISGSVYAEYEEVIRRPRFRRSEGDIGATLRIIRDKGLWVRPVETIGACSDPDDDAFLECAHAARASYLVTGNLKHFPASWSGTRIVTARRLLDIVSGATGEGPVLLGRLGGCGDTRLTMRKQNIGSSFDIWLREEGTYEEVTATAIARVLARQVEAAAEAKNLRAEMARSKPRLKPGS